MPAPKPDKPLLTAIEKERLADANLDPVIRKRNDMIVRNKILSWLNNSYDVEFALNHIHLGKLKKEIHDLRIYTLLNIIRELLDIKDFGKLYDIGKDVIVVKPFEGHNNPNFPPNPRPRPAIKDDFWRILRLEQSLQEINYLIPEIDECPAYEKFKDKSMDKLSNMFASAKVNGLDLQYTTIWNRKGIYYLANAQSLMESRVNEKSKSYMEKSIDFFDKAIEADPTNVDAWRNKAFALDKLGRRKEAFQCYDKIVTLDPYDANSWFLRGFILYEFAGNEDEPDNAIEESIRSFDKVLEMEGSNNLAATLKLEAQKFREEIKK